MNRGAVGWATGKLVLVRLAGVGVVRDRACAVGHLM